MGFRNDVFESKKLQLAIRSDNLILTSANVHITFL